MLLQWPARLPAGQMVAASTLVSSLDLLPTALHAAGLPLPPRNAGGPLDGRSLLHLLRGGSPPAAAPSPPAYPPAGGGGGGAWRDSLWFEVGFAASVKRSLCVPG